MALDYKAAKQQRKAIEYQATTELIRELAKNPVIELVAAYAIIEWLQKNGNMGSISGTACEVACTGAVVAQQIAPLMPYLAQGGQNIADTVKTLAPLAMAAI